MTDDWCAATVGEVTARVTKGTTPTTLGGRFVERGISFVKVESLAEDGRILPGKLAHINEATDALLPRSRLEQDDILFTIAGTIGRTALVPSWLLPANTNQAVAIVRPNISIIVPRFLFYVLRDESRVRQARTRVVQSVQANFSLGELSSLEIPLPPLAEQTAIAAVLGALDDKIELNRRMNVTLEAMAQALFKSWFVDFDLVRAQLDGRRPGVLDSESASHLPAAVQDSEVGHIPEGWKVGNVNDLATLNRDAVDPGNFPTETFDHFSLPAFDGRRAPKLELGSAIMSNKLTVVPNSVLLSKLNPHIPRIWMPDLNDSRRSVCSTEFMVLGSKPGVTREFLFSLFTNSTFSNVFGTLVTGTTGSHQRVRPESLLDMKIVIPPSGLIRAFTDLVQPMFDRINRNIEQSQTLANLRDTLLPKLLSGELRVAAGNHPELPDSSNRSSQKP